MVIWHIQYSDMNQIKPQPRIPMWMIPAGLLVLIGLFFLASWLTESWVAVALLDTYPPKALDQAVFEANMVSYGLLSILVCWLLIAAIGDRSHEYQPIDDAERIVDPVESWQVANESARRGMARLKAAEDEVARRRQDRRVEPVDYPSLDDVRARRRAAA